MRRVADLTLWVLLLCLPALLVAGRTSDREEARVEQVFIEDLGLARDSEARTNAPRSLATAWFFFFFDMQRGLGTPGWLGRPLAVAIAWLLFAAAFAVLVAGALGNLAAAVSLVLLSLHPQLRGLGTLITPWLPAAAFTMLGLAFLQGLVLPTVVLRRRSPARWGPRIFGVVGCGLSLGLASSAESRIGWIMLIPSALLLLSLAAVGLTLWRVRKAVPQTGFRIDQWAILRRTFPWAVCWILVLVLLVEVYAILEPADTERLSAFVAPATAVERGFAWLALPGIVFLGYREGQRLGFRSQLGGRTVLFACLATLWAEGPAIDAGAGVLERLLAAPVFAASVGSWIRWRA